MRFLARSAIYRFQDLVIPGAPAQVAGQRLLDLVCGRLGDLLQQVGGRHQQARRAVAALDRAGVNEGPLEGVQPLLRPGE